MRVIAEETGSTLENRNGDGIEHFGYVDGRSQPLFIDEELDGRARDDGRRRPLEPARSRSATCSSPTRGVPDADHAYGSYLVYRKLEQNVRAFKLQEAALAGSSGWSARMPSAMGALLVGRFEDGTPLTLAAPRPDAPDAERLHL